MSPSVRLLSSSMGCSAARGVRASTAPALLAAAPAAAAVEQGLELRGDPLPVVADLQRGPPVAQLGSSALRRRSSSPSAERLRTTCPIPDSTSR